MLIKEASNKLLDSDTWNVLSLFEQYKDCNGLGVTYTTDAGRSIRKAFADDGGHGGAAHVCQTTYK